MHTHCLTNYRRRHNACPSCKEDWTSGNNLARLKPVGEAAFREGQDQRRRARRRSTEEREDGEDEEDAEPDISQSQGQEQEQDDAVKEELLSQPNGRGKGKRRAVPVEDTNDEGTPPPRTQQRRSSRRG